MTIKTRIKLFSAFMLAMIAIVAFVGIFSMNSIGNQIEDIAEADIPLTEMLAEIEVKQLHQEIVLEQLLRTANIKAGAGNPKALEASFKKYSDEVDQQLAAAEKLAQYMADKAHDVAAKAEGKKILAAVKNIETEAGQYHKAAVLLIAAIEAGASIITWRNC